MGSPATMMRFSAFAATIFGSVNFVASSAFAYHPGGGHGGSIGAILPIAVVVVLGMVGLGIWGRKKRKTKRKHKRKRR
jgi:hypothetical protein